MSHKKIKISEGDVVILRKDKVHKLETVTLNKKVWFEGQNVILNGIVGHPYNSTFIASQGALSLSVAPIQPLPEGIVSNDIEMRDNRSLVNAGNNQTLSSDDIDAMRNKGIEGHEIVEKLVRNSSTFQEKTVFAQEKYLKKKTKKHVDLVTILRPTTRVLCEMYSQKSSSKILGLRIDTVAQILAYANVYSGSNVLLSETCCGLLLGAVLERIGPDGGQVVHCFHGTAPLRPDALTRGAKNSNEEGRWHSQVLEIPLRAITSLRETGAWEYPSNTEERKENNGRVDNESTTAPPEVEMEEATIEENRDADDAEDKTSLQHKNKGNRKRKQPFDNSTDQRSVLGADIEKKKERLRSACQFLLQERMDCLIVATRFEPVELTLNLLHFLSGGRPFVVFCPFIEPLVKLYEKLKQDFPGMTGLLRITDTWLRSYQVLPERTHPLVTMSGHGGYLLTGYKLICSEDAPPIPEDGSCNVDRNSVS